MMGGKKSCKPQRQGRGEGGKAQSCQVGPCPSPERHDVDKKLSGITTAHAEEGQAKGMRARRIKVSMGEDGRDKLRAGG